jgi:AraC family transcriptional regulator, transcriptional activator of pobA
MENIALLDIGLFQSYDKHDEFYINTLENHLETFHKDISVPHKHDFYVAVLFTHGNGVHEVDFSSYPVSRGTLFFLNPGQTHHWELSDDISGYVFLHTRAFYEQHYTQNRLSQFPFYYSMHNLPIVLLSEDETKSVERLFTDAMGESLGNNLMKRQKVLSLINLVYIESTRAYRSPNNDPIASGPYSDIYTRFEALVEKNFPTVKSPSQYADMLNISSKHLNRIVKAVAGKTASDIIQDRIMLEAKKELLLHRHNFAEIAAHLGFEDYAYFSRVFKKRTGETPSEFVVRYRRT